MRHLTNAMLILESHWNHEHLQELGDHAGHRLAAELSRRAHGEQPVAGIKAGRDRLDRSK